MLCGPVFKPRLGDPVNRPRLGDLMYDLDRVFRFNVKVKVLLRSMDHPSHLIKPILIFFSW